MPYKNRNNCQVCNKEGLVNPSSHIKYAHAKTVLHSAKQNSIVPSTCAKGGELITNTEDLTEMTSIYNGTRHNLDVNEQQLSPTPANKDKKRSSENGISGKTTKRLCYQSDQLGRKAPQKAGRAHGSTREITKEKRKKHVQFLFNYHKWSTDMKRQFLQTRASGDFLRFLREICLNAMHGTIEFDDVKVTSYGCECMYRKLIESDLSTNQIRHILICQPMVSAIDVLIPATLHWWTGSFVQ